MTSHRCQKCERELPADSPAGVCPQCVFGLARNPKSNEQTPTQDHSRTSPVGFPSIDELNRALTNYRVENLLGMGGMGAVYRAFQPSLERQVALKIMSPRFADDPSFSERFAREAKTMARLNHQNIVNVYDYGQTDQFCYLVMEFVEGVNLRHAMREGSLTAEQALAIVPQVCEALQFAHDEGIIHRDIKPENILLDKRGRVKIADFGLAKLVDENAANWTLTGSRQILGTVNYMAPEQIERPTAVDHRADIYSLGVVLYELLTGELPLGKFQLPGEKIESLAALDQVVEKTLEKLPERRYQQASEFRSAVEMARNSSGFRPIGDNRPENHAVPQFAQGNWAALAGNAAAAVHKENKPIENLRVPFSIENPWHGMTVTHGVLSLTADAIKVNYSKRDNVFNSTILGDSGTVQIPFSKIVSADFQEGCLKGKIILDLDSLDDIPSLPTDYPGSIRFHIKPNYQAEAEQLTSRIRTTIGKPPLPAVLEKPAEREARIKRRMRIPAACLAGTGAVNVLFVLAMFLIFTIASRGYMKYEVSARIIPPPAPAITPPDKAQDRLDQGVDDSMPVAADSNIVIVRPPHTVETERASTRNPIDAIERWAHENLDPQNGLYFIVLVAVAFVLGIAFFFAAYCCYTQRAWGFCLAMLIVGLLPFHPGFLVGLPFGIWGLMELCRGSVRFSFQKE
ncbi:MAG: serine/threonine protein kinase [Pirellulaceae bacterium]|nr:serine/threonine protein kinase [Pirellulaceae bacterium]